MEDWLDETHWNVDDLVPTVTQDHEAGRVLIITRMSRETLTLTASENHTTYWSRSCGELQHKGEESGHTQKLHKLHLDHDVDTVILMVEQVGGVTYHTGWESCFRRVFENGAWKTVDPVLKDPDAIHEHAGHHHD